MQLSKNIVLVLDRMPNTTFMPIFLLLDLFSFIMRGECLLRKQSKKKRINKCKNKSKIKLFININLQIKCDIHQLKQKLCDFSSWLQRK